MEIDGHLIATAKEKLGVSVAVDPLEAKSRQHAQGAAEVAGRDEQVKVGVGPKLILGVHPARDRRAFEQHALYPRVAELVHDRHGRGVEYEHAGHMTGWTDGKLGLGHASVLTYLDCAKREERAFDHTSLMSAVVSTEKSGGISTTVERPPEPRTSVYVQ